MVTGLNRTKLETRVKHLALAVPTDELRLHLFGFFPSSKRDEGQRSITYVDADGVDSLQLRYARAGQLLSVAVSANLSTVLLSALVDAIETSLTDTGMVIARQVSFSDRPVTASWRYRDEFQISPAPDDAPRPNEMISDQHPFILEVQVAHIEDVLVQHHRRRLAVHRLQTLLPVLLQGPMPLFPQQHVRKHFVAVDSEAGGDLRTVYAQELYELPGFTAFEDAYSDPNTQLGIDPDLAGYWTPRWVTADEVLRVPSNATSLFDAAISLGEPIQSRFFRACYWQNMGRIMPSYSASLAYLCFVASIEALLTADESHTCVTCSEKHHPSLTKAFQKFLNNYAPDTPERAQFYARRSKVAHGSSLLTRDGAWEFGLFHPNQTDEDADYRLLLNVNRAALVNWLVHPVLDA